MAGRLRVLSCIYSFETYSAEIVACGFKKELAMVNKRYRKVNFPP
jgi:hypothetical protein